MCRWFFLFLIGSFSLFADAFLGPCIDQDVEVVYSYYQGDWIIGLSDGSSWKLTSLNEENSNKWIKWWNDINPRRKKLTSEYYFDPNSWNGHYNVSIFKAKEALSSKCKHIVVNQLTGQKAFAQFLPSGAQFVPRLEYARQLMSKSESSSSIIIRRYSFLGRLILLKNQSILNLYLSKKNKRSLSQWWNGVQIDQPDQEFISSRKDWKLRDKIKIYFTKIKDKDLSKKYGIKNSRHNVVILVNETRNKIAYASSVPFQEFLDAYEKYEEKKHQEEFSKGHEKGYQLGLSDGDKKGYKRARSKYKK